MKVIKAIRAYVKVCESSLAFFSLLFYPLAFCPGFDLVYTAEIRGQPLVLYKMLFSFI